MNVFETVKDLISFENVAGDHEIEFNRNNKANCPFHDEKTPSFHNYGTHGYCFGCGRIANVVDLEAHFSGLPPLEAALSLAKKYGVKLPELSSKDKEKANRQIEAQQLLERFATYAKKQIKKHPEVVEYLKKKGLDTEDLNRWLIGYVGNENPISKNLTDKAQNDLAREIGLIYEHGDHFKGRILFPIWNYGKIVNLSGRAFPDGDPKYLHLKNSELVHKQVAFAESLRNDRCVITEGLTDALAFIKVGIPACALLGTNPGPDAGEKLSKAKAKLFFCMDKDAAGEKTAYKLAKDFKGYKLALGFDKDADEILGEVGSEEFKKITEKTIKEAKYYLDLVIENEDLKGALKEIASLEFASDQEFWLRKLSTKSGTTFESLKEDIAKLNPRSKNKKGQKRDDSVWGGNFRDTLQNFQLSLDERGEKVVFENVLNCARMFLYLTPDTEYAFRIAFASVVANYFEDDPLWMLVVAPPSSAKTEIIQSLGDSPFSWNISSFTSKTLASGERNNPQASLLKRIGAFGLIFLKDLTTILELNAIDRGEIFSQLREVYDGSYFKTFGNGVVINWKGKIGVVGACTPIIEKYGEAFKVLGERFLMCRICDVTMDNEELALNQALKKQLNSINSLRDSLKTQVAKFLQSCLDAALRKEITFTHEQLEIIKTCAKFIAKARAVVVRDSYSRDDILVKPFQEAPMRVAKQLQNLIKGLCAVDGVSTPNEIHFYYLFRIALDNLPSLRKEIIEAVPKESIYRADLIRKLGYHEGSRHFRRLMEDLTKLGILKETKKSNRVSVSPSDTVSDFYALFDRFRLENIEEIDKCPENIPPIDREAVNNGLEAKTDPWD